jgi:energy-coupling factor transporter ATP-binding protein EcfA2
MDRLPPHYGHGVSGDRFWPRPALCEQVMTALKRGECVTLFGARRTGKSSLLRECARRLRDDDGVVVVEVNGEGLEAIATLFQQFVAALPAFSREGFVARVKSLRLPEPLLEVVQRWLDRGGSSGEDAQLVTRHWATLARAIAALLPEMPARPVLILDELAYLCEDLHGQTREPEEVKRLLGMLREWRGAGLGMAMASSVGIRQTLRRMGVSRNHLTGCPPVHIGPLTSDDAAAMLAALAADQQIAWWSDAVSRVVIDESIDLLPACLQYAFKHVSLCAGGDGPPDTATIRAVFRDSIQPYFDQELLSQFNERLADYTPCEQALAKAVFRSIARSTRVARARAFVDLAEAAETSLAGTRQAQCLDEVDLAELILALQEDGFLIDDRERDQIAFASRMVESWWRTRDHRRGRRG